MAKTIKQSSAEQGRAKQSFLKGTVILLAAMSVVKVIGAIYKIPLTGLLGGLGMGYFTTAYNLFVPVYAVCISGLPVAVAKLVAENASLGNYKTVRRIFKTSFLFFSLTGLLGCIIIVAFSKQLVGFVGNPDAHLAMTAIAPAVFFSCLIAAFRGYFEGLRNMYPTAISQIIEASVKLVLGLVFPILVLSYAEKLFERGEPVFGRLIETRTELSAVAMPVAAAAAVLALAFSTLASFLYIMVKYKLQGGGYTKEQLRQSSAAMGYRPLVKSLVVFAFPVALGALVSNFTSLIDLASMMRRLGTAIERAPDVVWSMYQPYLPSEIGLTELPSFLYGCYNALAMTLFLLIPTITIAIGKSALPTVASAYALGNRFQMKRNIETVLRMTTLIAAPAGFGLFFMSRPILMLLFGSRPGEVEIAVPLLTILGLATIFAAFAAPVYNMLQAVGRVNVPIMVMLVGTGLKLLINYIFIAKPEINIQAAPYGTLICFVVIAIGATGALLKICKVRINVFQVFVKPIFCGILCGLSALGVYRLLSFLGEGVRHWEMIRAAASVIFAIFCYGFLVILTKSVKKDEILSLPMGKNIVKTLEKFIRIV